MTKDELLRLIATTVLSAAVFARAAEPDVSPAFVFNARYAASGVTSALWAANEASGFSALFGLRTQPLFVDTDGDGTPNWREARFSRSKTGLDATADADGDGQTALDEFVAYTDPTNAASFFSISIESDSGTAMRRVESCRCRSTRRHRRSSSA